MKKVSRILVLFALLPLIAYGGDEDTVKQKWADNCIEEGKGDRLSRQECECMASEIIVILKTRGVNFSNFARGGVEVIREKIADEIGLGMFGVVEKCVSAGRMKEIFSKPIEKKPVYDITVYYMSDNCPYCHEAVNFIDAELNGASVEKIDITASQENLKKFDAMLEKCKTSSRGAPLIIVKNRCIQGFSPEIGQQIKMILGMPSSENAITAVALHRTYETNKFAFKQKYGNGEEIQFEGKVMDIKESGKVVLEAGSFLDFIDCEFRDTKQVADLRKGQFIKLSCKYAPEMRSLELGLNDCYLR